MMMMMMMIMHGCAVEARVDSSRIAAPTCLHWSGQRLVNFCDFLALVSALNCALQRVSILEQRIEQGKADGGEAVSKDVNEVFFPLPAVVHLWCTGTVAARMSNSKRTSTRWCSLRSFQNLRSLAPNSDFSGAPVLVDAPYVPRSDQCSRDLRAPSEPQPHLQHGAQVGFSTKLSYKSHCLSACR